MSTASGAATADRLISTYVTVGRRTDVSKSGRSRLGPAPAVPVFYTARSVAIAGNEPPEWLMRWVLRDIGQHNLHYARSVSPDIVLVLEWHEIDREVTHLGRPLQPLDPRTRRIVEYHETRLPRHQMTAAQNASFCTLTAFDYAATRASPPRAEKLWQTELWFVYLNPVRRPSVHLGEPVVKDYFLPPSPTEKP